MSDEEEKKEPNILVCLEVAYRRGLEDMCECLLGYVNNGATIDQIKKKIERMSIALHREKLEKVEHLIDCI